MYMPSSLVYKPLLLLSVGVWFTLTAEGAEGIGEDGGSGSVEDKGSRSDSDGVKESGVLTEAMLNEEQRLHDAESRESSSEREKVTLVYHCLHCLMYPPVFFNIVYLCLPFPCISLHFILPPTPFITFVLFSVSPLHYLFISPSVQSTAPPPSFLNSFPPPPTNFLLLLSLMCSFHSSPFMWLLPLSVCKSYYFSLFALFGAPREGGWEYWMCQCSALNVCGKSCAWNANYTCKCMRCRL